MPPKRPPPLPKSLFSPNGPLASAPAPPASSLHPAFITDAHTFGSFLNSVDPPVTGSISIALPGVPVALPALVGGEQRTVPGNIVPCRDPHAAGSTVDLIVDGPVPWDDLDEAVRTNKDGQTIVLAGVLPPPLTVPSEPLIQSEEYNTYCGRLGELSLHSQVVLKALPPTQVWEDKKELERVVKMYVAPAIETFGTHRIVFGSPSAVPGVSGDEWYLLLRRCLVELGLDADALTQIMGSNAKALYGL